MWNHPIHIHGHKLWITGGDGGSLASVGVAQ
jgi:FtsP/CotA-like multicopper oxidase with cupredoxin domain